jgi:hypothetical protein
MTMPITDILSGVRVREKKVNKINVFTGPITRGSINGQGKKHFLEMMGQKDIKHFVVTVCAYMTRESLSWKGPRLEMKAEKQLTRANHENTGRCDEHGHAPEKRIVVSVNLID